MGLMLQESPRKVSVTEVKRNGGGAFHPFKKEKSVAVAVAAPPATAATASSSAENGGNSGGGGGGKGEDKGEQQQRKLRRCWSPELHRQFLQALQQLGGSHVATPNQNRELMKVDGLTNVIEYQPHHRHHPFPPPRGGRSTSPNSPSPPPISSSYYPSAPHMLLALSAELAGGPPPDDNQAIGNSPGAGAPSIRNPYGKKAIQNKIYTTTEGKNA